MKTILILLIIFSSSFAFAEFSERDYDLPWMTDGKFIASQAGAITISVDYRVELMAVICRLAGSPEYLTTKDSEYIKSVDSFFGAFKNHPVVAILRNLRMHRGIAYDAPVGLAIHLSPKDFKPLIAMTPFPERLREEWKGVNLTDLTDSIRDFEDKSSFQVFFDQWSNHYRVQVLAMKSLVERYRLYDWLSGFYSLEPEPKMNLILSDLVGLHNYGCSVRLDDESLVLTPIVGQIPDDFRYHQAICELVIHEFSHGYVNTIVDKNWSTISKKSMELYYPVIGAMKEQAYGTPKSFLYETFVRANTGRFVLDRFGYLSYKKFILKQRRHSFTLIEDLCVRLGEYEENRDLYPSFSDYFLELMKAINETEKKKEEMPNKVFNLTYLGVTDLAFASSVPPKTQVKTALEGLTVWSVAAIAPVSNSGRLP